MKDNELNAMRKSFKTVADRRKNLSANPQIEILKKTVSNTRENSIKNNKKLIEELKISLANNDIEFFYAENGEKACEFIFNQVKDQDVVAKSKSNTLGEIGLSKFLSSNGIDVVETDLGDRILQLKKNDNKPTHPTGPASHLNTAEIANIVNESMNINVNPEAREIMEAVRGDVLEKIADSNVGISGANSVAALDGSAVLIHNEGNISLISLMKTHIIVVGIDKLVNTIEEAISIVKLESAYATGKLSTSYMNVISGPSKTADIEKKLLKNMYGAEKVILVLLDNGRSEAMKNNPECLWCIGCGSCIVSCPVYNAIGNEFGFNNYLGGRGVAMSKFIKDNKTCFEAGLFKCTLCGLCSIECPVSIPTNELVEDLRKSLNDDGLSNKKHLGIRDNIKNKGSPF